MKKKELTVYEKIARNLFRDQDEAEIIFSKDENDIRKRYMKIITYWLDKPLLADKEIILYLINDCAISQSQAYRDLGVAKLILGNIRNATKNWHRYVASQAFLDIAKRAKADGNLMQENIAMANYAKYNSCDKDDEMPLRYDEIIPADFEMTSDVSVLDPKLKIKNVEEVRLRLREKYGNATDAVTL